MGVDQTVALPRPLFKNIVVEYVVAHSMGLKQCGIAAIGSFCCARMGPSLKFGPEQIGDELKAERYAEAGGRLVMGVMVADAKSR